MNDPRGGHERVIPGVVVGIVRQTTGDPDNLGRIRVEYTMFSGAILSNWCRVASFFAGLRPKNRMRFIEGPPTFAVEVRSENDYGDAAKEELAAKRLDYFLAGTLVVWDVDPLAETIAVYRPDAPDRPTVFRRSDVADAEPAVPGWRLLVDEAFAV